MYRIIYTILLAALAITPLATNVDEAIALEKRQSVNLSTGVTSTEFTSIPPSTTTAISTGRITSNGGVVETTATSIISDSSSVAVSVTQVTSTVTPTNSKGSATGAPSVVTSESSASYSITYSSYVTSELRPTTISYVTTVNGQTFTASSVVSTLVPVSTSARVTGSLIASSSGGSSSGLSDSSKKIIGGVVGGVGGALLIGALGFTAWRIWGKKKNLHDDDLYDPNSQQEKFSSSTDNANTPFQSTLDQYHRPGPVNTAANF